MKERLMKIDIIRGITLISMILYHFLWDLKYIAGFNIGWYSGLYGHIWQRSICISFIFISGFCFSLGKKRLKRSLEVFVCGIIISAVTLIVMPENRIVFGILTFMGSASLITILIDKIIYRMYNVLDSYTLNLTLLIMNFLLFLAFYNINGYELNLFIKKIQIPSYFYDGYFATFLGFPDKTFFSTDYFSLMPWMFLYLMGYFSYKILCYKTLESEKEFIDKLCDGAVNHFKVKSQNVLVKSMAFIGKSTLIIYMIHQPILYLITIVIIKLG